MNIFILDTDPAEAARLHCDRHVVKMPLETAQLLCTALSIHGVGFGYKPTHEGHPCTLWAAESRANFLWLVRLGLALVDEHGLRYAHTKAGKPDDTVRPSRARAHARSGPGRGVPSLLPRREVWDRHVARATVTASVDGLARE